MVRVILVSGKYDYVLKSKVNELILAGKIIAIA
jgi:hypothetical protein